MVGRELLGWSSFGYLSCRCVAVAVAVAAAAVLIPLYCCCLRFASLICLIYALYSCAVILYVNMMLTLPHFSLYTYVCDMYLFLPLLLLLLLLLDFVCLSFLVRTIWLVFYGKLEYISYVFIRFKISDTWICLVQALGQFLFFDRTFT